MDLKRKYYHILTNNNGDSLADLAERELAFDTSDYPDGDYRIVIEARDEYGNATRDSMDVRFRNGLTGLVENSAPKSATFQLQQNYPNPFNSTTAIRYSIPQPGLANLALFDLTGREICSLFRKFHPAGEYWLRLDARQLASGIYFYRLQWQNNSSMRKMVVIH